MPSDPWKPEFPVDARRAALLAARLLPETVGLTPIRVGEGWDNDVWRFGEWTLRFPRRPLAVELIQVEAKVLPAIAPLLPIAVPAAEHVGRASADHPAPYIAHRYLPGTTLDRARLDGAARARLAPQIAAFLSALHGLSVPMVRAHGAPDDDAKRDVSRRRALIRERLPRLRGTRYGPWLEGLRTVADAPGPAPGERRSVCHGDLYPRHLLVDGRGDLCGALDWGDVMISHPGIDLSIAWTFLPPKARAAFFAAYGPIDAGTETLARVSAAHYATALGLYALDVGDEALADDAEQICRNVTAAGAAAGAQR